MAFDICERKCQTEAVKEALKNLPEPQQYTVNVRFLNVHTFSLRMHFLDISDSEKEAEKELMSVNAVCQQSSKVVP